MKGFVFVPPGNQRLLLDELDVKNVVAEPKQKSDGPLIDTNGTAGAVVFEIVISLPLSVGVTTGRVETTLIRYPVPSGIEDGITPNIYVLSGMTSPPSTIEPISVGVSKLPVASES